jgi:hypothetical protein
LGIEGGEDAPGDVVEAGDGEDVAVEFAVGHFWIMSQGEGQGQGECGSGKWGEILVNCAKNVVGRRICCGQWGGFGQGDSMSVRHGLGCAVAVCFLSAATMAQNAPVATPPGVASMGGGTAELAPVAPAPIESTVLPDGRIDGVQLADYLALLHQKFPEFNSVIVRPPGVPDDYPTLPVMDLKGVTIGQLLDFVKASHPNIQVQRIDGPSAPLYVIHVGVSEDILATGGAGAKILMGAPIDPTTGLPVSANNVAIHVYRLSDIVNNLARRKEGDGDHVKQALDDVLSLLQAALDAAGEKDPAVLKVHSPTLTLVFKGTPSQLGVITQTLDTLAPNKNDLQDTQRLVDAEVQNRYLKEEITELRNKNANTQPTK